MIWSNFVQQIFSGSIIFCINFTIIKTVWCEQRSVFFVLFDHCLVTTISQKFRWWARSSIEISSFSSRKSSRWTRHSHKWASMFFSLFSHHIIIKSSGKKESTTNPSFFNFSVLLSSWIVVISDYSHIERYFCVDIHFQLGFFRLLCSRNTE